MSISSPHTLSDDTFRTLLLQLLVKVEGRGRAIGTGNLETTGPFHAYYDSEGILTFGIGLNLRVTDNVLNLLSFFGYNIADQATQVLATRITTLAARPGLAGGISQATQDTLDNLLRPVGGVSHHAGSFTLIDAQEEKDLFFFDPLGYGDQGIYNNYLKKIPSEVSLPDTKEQVAFYSLVFNLPTLIGNGIKSGSTSDSRASVWYEIRYNSNGGTHTAAEFAAVSKRRYVESQVFSLYGGAADPDGKGTPSQSKELYLDVLDAYRALTAHRVDIISYEGRYSSNIANANRDFGDVATVQTWSDVYHAAWTYLKASYGGDLTFTEMSGDVFSTTYDESNVWASATTKSTETSSFSTSTFITGQAPAHYFVIGGHKEVVARSGSLAVNDAFTITSNAGGVNSLTYTKSNASRVVTEETNKEADANAPDNALYRARVVTKIGSATVTDLVYGIEDVKLASSGVNTIKIGKGVKKSDLTGPDGKPATQSFDGGTGGKNTFDLSTTTDTKIAITAATDPINLAPYAFSITGLTNSDIPVVATDFQNLIFGSGDDTFSIDPQSQLDLSTLKVIDGGAGNNTITAGNTSKTIYYGGSYGSNTLSGTTTNTAKTVSRLVGGPSADDLQARKDDPNLPSLGDASAANYTLRSGTGSAIMVGGAGTNRFEIARGSPTIIWGGGGTSTYDFAVNTKITIAHMDNPTAEKVAHLDLSPYENLVSTSYGGGGGGFTVIIDPGASDRLIFGGKTITDVSTREIFDASGFHYGSKTDIIDSPNSEHLTVFDSIIDYSGVGFGFTEYYGEDYVPGTYTGQTLDIGGFKEGDFGIKDHLSYFASDASWGFGSSFWFDANGQAQKKEFLDPKHPYDTKSLTDGEKSSTRDIVEQQFTDFKKTQQPAHGTPNTIHEANADGDTLTPSGPGDTLIGGGNNVSYAVAATDGSVTVDNFSLDAGGNNSQVVFTSTVVPASISVSADDKGDIKLSNTTTSKVVTVTKALSDPDYAIGGVTFADGSTLTQAQLAALAVIGSSYNTSLYGFSGADLFDSRGFAHFAHGIGGADTFVYNVGYGALTISETASNLPNQVLSSTLQLGDGITPENLVETFQYGSVILTDGVTGDVITLQGMATDAASGVQVITFADGTVWNRAQLLGLARRSTTGADRMFGTPDVETFDGQGAPAGFADYAEGGGGADTFVFKAGYGQLEISEAQLYYAADAATLLLGPTVRPTDVRISLDNNGNILIADGVAGDLITVDAMLFDAYYRHQGIAALQFNDGTVWTRAQIVQAAMAATNPGPTVSTTTVKAVGHDKTVLIGSATPGLAGDVLSLATPTAGRGTLLLVDGKISYQAPDSAGLDSLGYVVTDQLGHAVSGTFATTVDGGPILTVGMLLAGHGQSVPLSTLLAGLVTPGLTGDTVTITAISAANGNAAILSGGPSYTAPAAGGDTITYTATDQLGDTATGTVVVTIDPGPTLTLTSVAAIGHGQAVKVGTVIPGTAGDVLTLATTTSGRGALSLANGVLTYAAPATGGPDSVSYTVTDQVGDSATGTVSVVVNEGPVVASGTLRIGHGKTASVTGLIASLITPGLVGDVETLSAVSALTGAATLTAGATSYTAPAAGADVLSFTVTDQLGDTTTGSVAVTIDPGPMLTATAVAKVGHGKTVQAGTVAPGLSGDVLTLATVIPGKGTLSLAGGVLSYAAGTTAGADTVGYTITDQLGDVVSGVFATTVDAGPIAATGKISIGHGSTRTLASLLVGLVTPGLVGDTETITALSAKYGQTSLAGGQDLYTAPASGTDTITYTVTDQVGDTATGTVAVTVTPGAVLTLGATASPSKVGHGQSVKAATVTPASKTDVLTLATTTPGLGTMSLANGVLTYTASAAGGVDNIGYTVTSQVGDVVSGTFSTVIDPGPTVGSLTLTTGHGQVTDLTTLVAYFIKPGLPGDVTSYASFTAKSGRASITAAGLLSYTAPAAGTDTISYTVKDQLGDTATGTVSVTVDAGPILTKATVAKVGHGQAVQAGTVAVGIAGDTLNLSTTTAGRGTLTLASGILTYVAPAVAGVDSVSYTIRDQLGDTVSGTFSTLVDAGPTAANGNKLVGHDQAVSLTSLLASLTTSGLAGDTKIITAVTAATGQATVDAMGAVTYQAPATGTDTVSYTVSDQLGETAMGTVAITVDKGPALTAATIAKVAHGQAVQAGTVLPGVAGDVVALSITTAGRGKVALANGVLTYTAPTTAGADSVGYTIKDQVGDVVTGTFATLVDGGPVLAAGKLTIGHGQTSDLSALLLGLATPGLAGDTETITAVSAKYGAVTPAGRAIPYTAPASGSDTLTYTVTDQLGETATGSVAVTVDGGPKVTGLSVPKVGHGQTVKVATVAPGITGDVVTLATLNAGLGSLSLANGSLSYTASNAGGADSIGYQLTDQYGDVVGGTFVTQVDPGPTAGTLSTTSKLGATTDLTNAILGVDKVGLAGDVLSLFGVGTTGMLGAVSFTNGHITYAATGAALTAAAKPSGVTDSFAYTVRDQLGDTAAGLVVISVK